MQNLTIVGTEDGALVLVAESGERFTLPVNEVLRREIQRAHATESPRGATVNPREIQKHIRAGLTEAEAAELLNVPIEDVSRFAGPVIAEREHVINQALAAPVILGSANEPATAPTFGGAIRKRLAELEASEEHWASWKTEKGWTIKLEFVANEISHDARWSFEPRNGMLAPINHDATQLSQQGDTSEGLIPRLRAVDTEAPSPYKDESRFDSGAFNPRPELAFEDEQDSIRSLAAVQQAAMSRAPEDDEPTGSTADLLEALRRRRGQREGLPFGEDEDASSNATAPIALFEAIEENEPSDLSDISADIEDDFDIQIDDFLAPAPAPAPMPVAEREDTHRRRRRETLPPWDDIVFGTRSDE